MDGAGVVPVQFRNPCHIICRQGEVEDIEILRHALLVAGLRDGDDAALGKPPQGYLGRALAVLRTDGGKFVILDDAIHTLATQRPPGHHLRPGFREDGLDPGLLDERVALQLVHHRLHVHIMGEVEEAARLEVAYPDRPDLPGSVGLLHGPPGAEHIAVSLVDEHEVDVLCLQFAETLVDAPARLLLSGIADPYLRHQEQILAGNPALSPGFAHAIFVRIGLGGIDKTVPYAQCVTDASFTFPWTHQKDAIAEGRHLDAV